VYKDLDARMLVAEHLHVLRPEHLVDTAMSLPEDHLAFEQLLFGAAAE